MCVPRESQVIPRTFLDKDILWFIPAFHHAGATDSVCQDEAADANSGKWGFSPGFAQRKST